MKRNIIFTGLSIFLLFSFSLSFAAEPAASEGEEFYDPFADEESAQESPAATIADPFAGYNRLVFSFNDRLYFYVLKPVARGYSFVVPEVARKSVKRFFANLATPKRFLNCLLQGKVKGAGMELSRLVVNSTIGVGGLFDPAKRFFNLIKYKEDSGQTIGFYGIGTGPYLELPFFGPSSIRDSFGTVMDMLLDPLLYLDIKFWERVAIRTGHIVNNTSLIIGEYEHFKKAAIDPYVAKRNAYYQHRESEIKE